MRTPRSSQPSSSQPSAGPSAPSYALPTRVFASDAELSSLLRTDMQSVDFALRQLVTAQQDRRRAHETSLLECRAQESKLERLRGQLDVARKDMEATLESEKQQVSSGEARVEELEHQQKALQEQVDGLQADVYEWEAKLKNAQQGKSAFLLIL